MKKVKNPERQLDRALEAQNAAQLGLARVMETAAVWRPDGPYVTDDIKRAAAICGLPPEEMAGYDQVLKRVRGITGTTREVARLTALLEIEPTNP